MIFLAAAAIYATRCKNMDSAVKQAKMLWAEVIKQDKEDS